MMPSAPAITACAWSVVSTIRMVRSVFEATSLADDATSALSLAVLAGSMSCTTSGTSALMRFRAIGPPMAPRPMNPTLPVISSSRGLWCDCSGGPTMGLQGKIALVTGASRGLGEGAARALARQGARVMLVARDGALAKAVAREIGGAAMACDVSDYAAVERM